MPAYHYQCASCYCTLSLDPEPADRIYYSVVNGDLCWSCQSTQDANDQYDDDDD